MTTIPIRTQARRATTTANYKEPSCDLSDPRMMLKRLCAGVIVNAIRSLVKHRRKYEYSDDKAKVEEWLWQERECLRDLGITNIPNTRAKFITWIYGIAEGAKREQLYIRVDENDGTGSIKRGK